ncbi:MAG: phosphate ABC transporter permease subunit PstC [Verrucomicrobiales bacterium]|nr:phosphate ABC transporter permease subunit PstC [Verrucomicrobiales bacterium]
MESPREKGQFVRRRRTFLGLNVQDAIRYFFGGNAALAIVILVLICGFLLHEGFGFFPEHHRELKRYRMAGLEYVAFIDEEVKQHTLAIGQLRQAFYQEINADSVDQQAVVATYGAVKRHVESEVESLAGRANSFAAQRENLEFQLDLKRTAVAAKKKTGEQISSAMEKELEGGDLALTAINEKISEAKNLYIHGVREAVDRIKPSDLEETTLISDSAWGSVVRGVSDSLINGEKPVFITALEDVIAERQDAARLVHSDFAKAIENLNGAIGPDKKLWSALRKVATVIKAEAVAVESAPARKAALITFAQASDDPAEKAKRTSEAEAVVIGKVDFSERTKPLYASVEEHAKISKQLQIDVAAALDALPVTTTEEQAAKSLRAARQQLEDYVPFLKTQQQRIAAWRHDKPYSVGRSVMAFIVGTEWITNSSWQDFYGLLPLFIGSLMIAIVAIVVSVPLAVGAAIYVNQLARRSEQNAIKPIIEFIGAIPSVVLGFFGILVLGTTLRTISQVEWLSDIPGFPMAERLNILTAGLLLAFMAIPTIFTLAEDAISNVPSAFSEGSMALGASKLQTVLGVVVPTALSGIVAAILLGFGRIIGETMVVLLVAGNKIAIPDFSQGLGAFTQPVHTMTGIIAQELGEVDAGSLHWRALFMVGLVLFLISLVINFFAQRLIKRFQAI